jgi:hypothetical protein
MTVLAFPGTQSSLFAVQCQWWHTTVAPGYTGDTVWVRVVEFVVFPAYFYKIKFLIKKLVTLFQTTEIYFLNYPARF